MFQTRLTVKQKTSNESPSIIKQQSVLYRKESSSSKARFESVTNIKKITFRNKMHCLVSKNKF